MNKLNRTQCASAVSASGLDGKTNQRDESFPGLYTKEVALHARGFAPLPPADKW
jgi:hypothetical protein